MVDGDRRWFRGIINRQGRRWQFFTPRVFPVTWSLSYQSPPVNHCYWEIHAHTHNTFSFGSHIWQKMCATYVTVNNSPFFFHQSSFILITIIVPLAISRKGEGKHILLADFGALSCVCVCVCSWLLWLRLVLLQFLRTTEGYCHSDAYVCMLLALLNEVSFTLFFRAARFPCHMHWYVEWTHPTHTHTHTGTHIFIFPFSSVFV